MADNRLLNYVKANLANGATEEQVRKALAEVGWAEDLVNETFEFLNKPKEEEFISLPSDEPIKESRSVRTLWVVLIAIVILLTIGVVVFVVMNSEEKNGEAKTVENDVLIGEELELEEEVDLLLDLPEEKIDPIIEESDELLSDTVEEKDIDPIVETEEITDFPEDVEEIVNPEITE